jgi:hypothetical protein
MHELCSRQAGYQKLGVVESGVIRWIAEALHL